MVKREKLTKKFRNIHNKTIRAIKTTDNLYTNIVGVFLTILNTVKLYHWKTKSYSTHKATDELYEALNSKIDSFVEILLGKEIISSGKKRDKILNVKNLKFKNYKNQKDFKKQIEEYKLFLINLSKSSLNTPTNSDLMNLRDEILGLMNQFLYLLTLN
tara:strand:+ start:331 stop:804 length:474 start_codon:yes stop_codon:yes gene_type:complete